MRRAVIALLLVGAAGACSTASPSAGGKPSVVAAFYPLAFVAQRIGGSAVAVTNLTPPGAEPHDLELRPSDVVAIRNADLLLYLSGLQPAVDEASKTLDASHKMDVLSLISLRHLGDGPVDPHF